MPVYLFQRSTRYYVRVHIPPDLQPLFQVKEFKYSLKTGDLRQARHRSRLIINFIHSMLRTVRECPTSEDRMPDSLSPEKLTEIIRKYVQDALDWEEEYQSNTILNPYEHEERLQFLEELIAEHRAVIGEGRHRQEYKRQATNLIKSAGIELDSKADDFNKLCRMLAHADVKTSEIVLKWQKGEWSASDKVRVMHDLGLAQRLERRPPSSDPQAKQVSITNGKPYVTWIPVTS
jgi:hypothetical protein